MSLLSRLWLRRLSTIAIIALLLALGVIIVERLHILKTPLESLDNREITNGEGDRTVKRLTWRIALSLLLFLALWAAYQMGYIEPKSGPVNWPQAEQAPDPE